MLKEPETPRGPTEADDTRPISGRGDDRLLVWCLIASLFINFGFGLWMNLADVYGTQRTKEEIKRVPLKIYHPPPIKKKPPKPKPPKKITPPKVVKIVHEVPKPTPPPPQHFTVGSKSTNKNAVVMEQSAPPAPPEKTEPVQQITTPAPAPAAPPPVPPAPEVKVVPPTPTPPPPPPKPVHRPGYSEVGEQEVEALSDYSSPDVPADADVTTLHSCTITFTVSETGRVTNARVTSRSGNSDLDDGCLRAIQGMRFKPAIQDHYPQEQRMSHTFSFSG